jgi:hypothetical protein
MVEVLIWLAWQFPMIPISGGIILIINRLMGVNVNLFYMENICQNLGLDKDKYAPYLQIFVVNNIMYAVITNQFS